MDISKFVKKFELPARFAAPTELRHGSLVATPLSRADLDDDMAGVNSSIEIIQKTRGGSWPTGQLEKDFDLLDLSWHEREFRDGSSFAYVVRKDNGEYVGCFYLYPMGHRTPLKEDSLDYDVDASWWVTAAAYEQGEYPKLFAALKQWLTEDFPFQKPYFSNREIPG